MKVSLRREGENIPEGLSVTPTAKNWFVRFREGNTVTRVILPRSPGTVMTVDEMTITYEGSAQA
jgi:hypothetical protein